MEGNLPEVTQYTKEDFLTGTAPYEEVYRYIDDPFEFNRQLDKMTNIAKVCGVRNFKGLFKLYNQKLNSVRSQTYAENITNFSGQDLELDTGNWTATDNGVSRYAADKGHVVACMHPIMPVERLVNIDTGIEKIRLAYKKGGIWRTIVVDKETVAKKQSITKLANCGVAVTSENAGHLVQYIHDVENLNYELIPEHQAVSRLGWVKEGVFSPYVEDVLFDGQEDYKHIFDAITTKGSYDKWLQFIREIRAENNIPAKIMLAASFASVLVGPCNCLPFFIHLWNGSGNGKSVSLMLAASVWGNPEIGRYIHTFNGTAVGQERLASFCNSLPVMLDELQIESGKKSDFDGMIYTLAEGAGRSRGTRNGGMQRTTMWRNCILTTGEQPLTSSGSRSGAINRVVDIDTNAIQFFKDAKRTADFLLNHYGFAGRDFIERLLDPNNMQLAKDTQLGLFDELRGEEITEKQVSAASLILTADALIDAWIFKDGNGLAIKDVTQFLATHNEVSADRRAYSWLIGWLAQNSKKFDEKSDSYETWGKVMDGSVAIIADVFRKACNENNFNADSFLSYLKRNDLLELQKSKKGYTKSVRIGGISCHCVVFRNEDYQEGFVVADDGEVDDF